MSLLMEELHEQAKCVVTEEVPRPIFIDIDYVVQCYGDSLTAGYVESGRRFHPYATQLSQYLTEKQGLHAEVQFTGLNGWTARELLASSKESSINTSDFPYYTGRACGLGYLMDHERCDLAVILLGTNDLAIYSADVAAENVWAVHRLLHSRQIRSILVSIPDSHYQHFNRSHADKRRDANLRLSELCRSEPLVTFTEFPITWSDESPLLWEPDGLHLSAAGYDELGRLLAPVVADVLIKHQKGPT